jgi:hypothetical protein
MVDADKETLAAIFASRVALAKKSLEEAIEEITRDYEHTKTWVSSQSQKEGSFLWFCDVFDLEPDAVRRAIKEKRK